MTLSDLLLFGFPGCGKTHLARAIEKEFAINFIYVKGPEILDKYIGGSEANVRRLFEEAEAKGPSVLFFDELDSIVPMRNSSTAAVTDRIVNQFLCYLDGVVPLKKTFVVAATSRPDLIDTAVIRPGRIDTHVFCGLPTPSDRKAVIQGLFCQDLKMNFDPSTLDELVAKTEGYSFADLNLMAQKMHLKRRQVDRQGQDWELLKEAFEEVKPFCRTKDYRKLQRVYQSFMSGSPDPEVMHQRHTLA